MMRPCHARTSKVTAGILGVIALISVITRAEASVKDNPYLSIVVRNSFHLRKAVRERVEEKLEITPSPKIQLTGVTNVAGKQWALLEITESGKPVKKPVLANGQMIDGIEVLQIDVPAGRVRLRVRGRETVVTLETRQATVTEMIK